MVMLPGYGMIADLASEMDYHNDAGINTLLIRIQTGNQS